MDRILRRGSGSGFAEDRVKGSRIHLANALRSRRGDRSTTLICIALHKTILGLVRRSGPRSWSRTRSWCWRRPWSRRYGWCRSWRGSWRWLTTTSCPENHPAVADCDARQCVAGKRDIVETCRASACLISPGNPIIAAVQDSAAHANGKPAGRGWESEAFYRLIEE